MSRRKKKSSYLLISKKLLLFYMAISKCISKLIKNVNVKEYKTNTNINTGFKSFYSLINIVSN